MRNDGIKTEALHIGRYLFDGAVQRLRKRAGRRISCGAHAFGFARAASLLAPLVDARGAQWRAPGS